MVKQLQKQVEPPVQDPQPKHSLSTLVYLKLLLETRDNLPDIEATVLPYRGANIQNTLYNAIKDLKHKTCDVIYFTAGVIELSVKTGHRQVLPRMNLPHQITELIVPQLENAALKLQTVSKKAVICELIGMSYSMYNNTEFTYIQEQQALNDAIIYINNQVTTLNEKNNVRSPLIQSYVHKWRHGRLGHRYESKLADGLHYNCHYRGQIAARFVDTFYSNIHATCN